MLYTKTFHGWFEVLKVITVRSHSAFSLQCTNIFNINRIRTNKDCLHIHSRKANSRQSNYSTSFGSSVSDGCSIYKDFFEARSGLWWRRYEIYDACSTV